MLIAVLITLTLGSNPLTVGSSREHALQELRLAGRSLDSLVQNGRTVRYTASELLNNPPGSSITVVLESDTVRSIRLTTADVSRDAFKRLFGHVLSAPDFKGTSDEERIAFVLQSNLQDVYVLYLKEERNQYVEIVAPGDKPTLRIWK
jgi:hypothetical protein